MLFNSTTFILFFLPITLLIFFQIGRWGHYRYAVSWLLAASLIFYGWWNSANLWLLIPSIVFNYAVGAVLTKNVQRSRLKIAWLVLGITVNLALIGYFKYANFFVATVNQLSGTSFNLGQIVLPLGISFFTFQQIGYLIDTYRGENKENYRFLDYSLFVVFFPQLIAGPLIHHKTVTSQLTNLSIYRFNPENLAIGITLFAVGLFKKVVFADGIGLYSTQIFTAAANGTPLTFVEAWVGALAFTLQLYFDFSGYSDMAIGLGRLFGIRLPINFNSPYKAVNIIEFWRRWHITLSNFLRDYLYIPLGGNRQGEWRRSINLMITMLLGGLWHGAGWTFVLWGGLHGLYLLINHQWRAFRQRYWGHDLSQSRKWARCLSGLLTFGAVVVGWVLFRAETTETAGIMLRGMVGLNGLSLPELLEKPLAFVQTWGSQFNQLMPNIQFEVEQMEDVNEISPNTVILQILVLLGVVWFLPNTQQWLGAWLEKTEPHAEAIELADSGNTPGWKFWRWRPSPAWAVISAIVTAVALLNLAKVSEFLYFEF